MSRTMLPVLLVLASVPVALAAEPASTRTLQAVATPVVTICEKLTPAFEAMGLPALPCRVVPTPEPRTPRLEGGSDGSSPFPKHPGTLPDPEPFPSRPKTS